MAKDKTLRLILIIFLVSLFVIASLQAQSQTFDFPEPPFNKNGEVLQGTTAYEKNNNNNPTFVNSSSRIYTMESL